MSLQFNKQPGPRERHLQRKADNLLFPEAARQVSQQQVELARQQDEMELIAFMNEFQGLVQEAVNLKPETDSDTIQDLKERLDKSYAHCSALPGDQNQIKQALVKLIDAIMSAIKIGAENDPKAIQELSDEELARETHFALHDYPLVADLMLDDSPIASDELIPTLLSENDETLQASLNLFDEEVLASIYQQAKELLGALKEQGHDLPQAWKKLKIMETFLTRLTPDNTRAN